MTIEYADLSKQGLIYRPHDGMKTGTFADHMIEFLNTDRDFPEIVRTVPNLRGFATGVDYNVGAFEIKAQNSRIVRIPSNLDFLLPTTALIIDDLYATAGPKVADQCQIGRD